MTLRRICLAALAVLALAVLAPCQPARAQDDRPAPAVLVADSVRVERDDVLIASGNVEVLQDDTRLTASRVIYDGASETVRLEGPLRITSPDGDVLLASDAELDRDLRSGLLRSARLVLDQQLQIAGVEARRAGGRYTQLSRAVASSCRICGPNGAPLWQIRASRVVHDNAERQLYFDNATLQIGGVPVFWAPRLRVPDPTLDRARGFLIPTLRSSSLLGLGIKLPYFIPIGDHQDLTLTPYLSPETTTLEWRYRRAFAHGDLRLRGALSRDTLESGNLRAYVFADGGFDLPRDYRLRFDVKTVNDPSYLSNYDYGSVDRLDSSVTVNRARHDESVQTGFIHYESLRDDEDNDTQPALVSDLRYERRLFPAALGGELRLGGILHGHYRYSSRPVDGTDEDLLVDGRDVARLTLDASWRNRWTLPGGVRAAALGQLWLDGFAISEDDTSDSRSAVATPAASVELRWPLLRQGMAGGRTLLEPVVQAGWVGGDRPRVANDESTSAEFDEGNLLALSRFPAADRRAHGTTAAAALRMHHVAPAGWQVAGTLGRTWRDEADPDYTRSSGLDGRASDWLIATRVSHPMGLHVTTRSLLDPDFEITKAEADLSWRWRGLSLDANYLLLNSDPREGRDDTQSEWTLSSAYAIDRHWQVSSGARYDLSGDRLDRVRLGLRYRNECIDVGVSASRKYARSENVDPSTEFDFTVALTGFGTGGSGKEFRRTCPQ